MLALIESSVLVYIEVQYCIKSKQYFFATDLNDCSLSDSLSLLLCFGLDFFSYY